MSRGPTIAEGARAADAIARDSLHLSLSPLEGETAAKPPEGGEGTVPAERASAGIEPLSAAEPSDCRLPIADCRSIPLAVLPGETAADPGRTPPRPGSVSFADSIAIVRTLPPRQATAGLIALMVAALIEAAAAGRRLHGLATVHILSAAGFTQAELIEHGGDAHRVAEAMIAEDIT